MPYSSTSEVWLGIQKLIVEGLLRGLRSLLCMESWTAIEKSMSSKSFSILAAGGVKFDI